MDQLELLKSIPVGALLIRPENEDGIYTKKIAELPPNVKKLISSDKTGAYVRGLIKNHDLPLEKTPHLAFCILQIAVGDKQISQLASLLSSELQLSNDISQKLSQELEKDLFAPVMLELNNYLAKKKQDAKQKSPTEGMGNVVNLKGAPKPNKPFPLPPKR